MKAVAILRKIDNGIIVENKGKSNYYPTIHEAIKGLFAVTEEIVFQFGNKTETLIEVELSEVVHSESN